MIIKAKPYNFFKVLKYININLYDSIDNDYYYYKNGRQALLGALQKLDINPDEVILIPALNCESSLEFLKLYSYKLKFIDIDEYLCIPVDSIARLRLTCKISAVVIIHYFGLRPKNLDEIINYCENSNIRVIEDKCHTLIPNQSVKSRSSAEIYSLRKMLPIRFTGGILFLKTKKPNNEIIGQLSIFWLIKEIIYSFGILLLLGCARINIYNLALNKFKITKKVINNNITIKNEFNLFLYSILKNKKYLENVRNKRIKNYEILLNLISKLGIEVFPMVSNNEVPMTMAIKVSSKDFFDYLRKKGVGIVYWPAHELPKEVGDDPNIFPISNKLNYRIACLPIHQELNDENMRILYNLISGWKSGF